MDFILLPDTRYLITTDKFFFGPDGRQYRAVWGKVNILPDSILGVKTNHHTANWFCRVGDDDNHVVIAGCQIHYACRCEKRPSEMDALTWEMHEGICKKTYMPCVIYFTE